LLRGRGDGLTFGAIAVVLVAGVLIHQFHRWPLSLPWPPPAVVRRRCQNLASARRVSQSVRIAGLFLALLIPAVAVYPSLAGFAIEAKERLIANEYGAQVIAQRDDLEAAPSTRARPNDALPAASAARHGAGRRRNGQPARLRGLVSDRAPEISRHVRVERTAQMADG
jgi:hypothetical protein